MPNLTIDTDQVRVVQADNYKGNSRVYIEIMDVRILYSDPHTLQASEEWGWLVKEDEWGQPQVDTDTLADCIRHSVVSAFWRELLLKDERIAATFSRDTDREIDYTKPRVSVEGSDPYA